MMDFDLCKENIQPLRGGRNVQQLEMALQAETNQEYQMQLLQQKEEFENLIRNYQGDDPLENYYNYISWVEQSYPKSGYAGNSVSLLEHCLSIFESDRRYTNDRRFCKLWIKYIDLFPNPLELYQMMKSKNLCTGCADFYRAWAYYYEAAGDFQRANNIFEEGKKNLAQPYEELEIAHKNLITAAGEHVLYGPNENRLKENRHALVSLHTYKPGHVSSIRIPNSNPMVTVPSQGAPHAHNNIGMMVYEDRGPSGFGAGAAPPQSIINVAKRQEAPKENTLKPGPWATVPVKKRVMTHKTGPGFTVLEDVQLAPSHPTHTLEDYSGWRVSIKYPEEPSPNMLPMYPKARVYIDPLTEFSIDELRATRYRKNPLCVQQAETCQAVQSILVDDDDDDCVLVTQEPVPQVNTGIYQSPGIQPQLPISPYKTSFNNIPGMIQQNSHEPFVQPSQQLQKPPSYPQNFAPPFNNSWRGGARQKSTESPIKLSQAHSSFKSNNSRVFAASIKPSVLQSTNSISPGKMTSPQTTNFFNPDTGESEHIWTPEKPKKPQFAVYEQSLQELPPHVQPKGSAMKTAFKTLNADDLVETGSRGGMDIAATAQPADSARPMLVFSDNSSSSYEDSTAGGQEACKELEMSCTTQQFNFNLNVMQVSTPQAKAQSFVNNVNEEDLQSSRKKLFTETRVQEKDKALSTILEETRSGYGSSTSSSGTTTKSSLFSNNHTNKMATISEEHNSYLAQNLMANAELRSSLLGELMDFNTPQPLISHAQVEPVVPMQSSPIHSPIRTIPAPAIVQPLNFAPSNPFNPNVINKLLERVAFPGPHSQGYQLINCNPRLAVKKEPILIGNERYVVEKQLGKGQFGTVFKAQSLNDGQVVALKFQRPLNKWEFYICRELQARLAEHPLRDRFMDVSIGYFGEQVSILVSDFMPFGSLLDAANLVCTKSGKPMKQCLCVHFTLEMLNIVKAMHEVKIIHADIKPDNFLVFLMPDGKLGLQLIDFGCSIDMTLFPPNTMFTRPILTDDFTCCEMKDGLPWSYNTDLFCVAATAHVLLFRDYIQLKKTGQTWSITHHMPRYVNGDLWNSFFCSLLNQKHGAADVAKLQLLFEEQPSLLKDLSKEMRYLVNLLKNR